MTATTEGAAVERACDDVPTITASVDPTPPPTTGAVLQRHLSPMSRRPGEMLAALRGLMAGGNWVGNVAASPFVAADWWLYEKDMELAASVSCSRAPGALRLRTTLNDQLAPPGLRRAEERRRCEAS